MAAVAEPGRDGAGRTVWAVPLLTRRPPGTASPEVVAQVGQAVDRLDRPALVVVGTAVGDAAVRLGPRGHAMQREQLKPNVVLQGPLSPEPVQVIVTVPLGEAVKVIAKGLRTSQVYEPVLSADQLGRLDASPDKEPFDGDPHRFRLGVEALRLGLAYEHDPLPGRQVVEQAPIEKALNPFLAEVAAERSLARVAGLRCP